MSRQHTPSTSALTALSRFVVASGLALTTLAGVSGCGAEAGGPMEVWNVEPRVGTASGEQPIRITGANFRQDIGYAVYFGSLRATAVTILDTSTLLVVTPQHEAGPVDVVVASEAGPAFRVQQAFTFNDPGAGSAPQAGQPGTQAQERF